MGHFSGKISRLWFANINSEMSIRHQMERSGMFFHFTGFGFFFFFFFSLYSAVIAFIHVPLLSMWWSMS